MIELELLPHYTVLDYHRWEGEWELIRGIPYAIAPSPTILHRWVRIATSHQLAELLAAYPNCLALDETDWIVSEDTVVWPDVMVICDEFSTKAPHLIFEVVSPAPVAKTNISNSSCTSAKG